MKAKWDQVGERLFRTGCDHGMLYVQDKGSYPKGVPWNGLTNVTESPSGAESNPQYADNFKYLDFKSAEQYALTIECFMYPDEWKICNGEMEIAEGVTIGQQRRKNFGFSWRTKLGNDVEGEDYGFEIHMAYGCSSTPSEVSHTTINESPEASTLSYEVSTTPVPVSGKGPDGKPYKPTSIVTVKSTEISPENLATLEAILYGTDPTGDDTVGTEPRLPFPDELKTLLSPQEEG